MDAIMIYGRDLATLIKSAFSMGVYTHTWGTWRIYGEDQNADLGGPHSNPHLETVVGTFEKAARTAVATAGYATWGAGGYIEKAEALNQLPAPEKTSSDPVRASSERVTRLRAALERAAKDHATALRNSEVRLAVMKKLEPIVNALTEEEVKVAGEVFAGLLKPGFE